MKIAITLFSFSLLFTGIMLHSCNTSEMSYKSPLGYDLTKGEKTIMPESLQEISGIAFYNGRPDTMYAIQDEQGKLYYFPTGKKASAHAKFGKQGDYEDVAICNETVIVLRSNGTLLTFPFSAAKYPEVENVSEWKDMVPKGEYESIYADNTNNQVYMLCKNCKADKSGERISGFIFQLSGDSLAAVADFSIDVSQIEALAQDKKMNFRPSCISKNPKTNEWYIVSSVNKLLVVLDTTWKVKEVFELNPSIFRQPEGMAFDNQNNLYISNEGDDLSNANVLKFTYGGK